MNELLPWLSSGTVVTILAGLFAIKRDRDARRYEKELKEKEIMNKRFDALNVNLEAQNARADIQNKAIIAVLNNQITAMIGVYLERGWVTITEYQNLLFLYGTYEAIGGNGPVKALMEEMKKIEIRK